MLTREEIDELLDKLRAATPESERPPDTYRTKEFALAWRVGVQTARARVERMRDEGKLRPVPIKHAGMNGRTATVIAYQIVR